jgi:hypothetical protein
MEVSELKEISNLVLALIGLFGPILLIAGILIFIAKCTGGNGTEEGTNVTN